MNYDARLAADAEKYAKQDRSSEGAFLSTRSGVLALGDEQLPGNQVAVVIVDSVLQNLYYEGAYDPNNKVPPVCYAFTRGEPRDMVPHLESMSRDQEYFMPQNMADDGKGGVIVGGCDGCPMAEWGSAMRSGVPGRGKACKNQYRLALLPAGLYQQAPNRRDWELGLHDTADHYAGADVVFLNIPVTSGSAFEKYRKMLRVQHARAPYGAVTKIYLTPHQTNQFSVNFELIELATPEMLKGIIPRVDVLESEPFKGYEAPSAEDIAPPPVAAGRFGGQRGIRR
jgi:hypothetical protein